MEVSSAEDQSTGRLACCSSPKCQASKIPHGKSAAELTELDYRMLDNSIVLSTQYYIQLAA